MTDSGTPTAADGDAESRYRELLELLPDAAVVHRDGRIRYCNSAALRLLGAAERRDLERQPVLAFLHPDERPRAVEHASRMRTDGRAIVRQETRLLRLDGETVHADVSIASVHYESREAILVIMRDVTDLRRAAEDLRRSEARLEEAIAAVNEGVWEMNLVTGETFRSPRIATMLGYEPDDFPGSTVEGWLDLLHPDDRERSLRNFMDHIAGELPDYQAEVRARTREGDWRWMLVRGRVVERDAVGRPVRAVGTQTDLTERRMLEQQLRQAQKMEAIGQLAGGIAHDFNNLLTAILGNLELAMSQLPETSAVRTELTDVSRAAARATTLTRKLLSFSRAQALAPETVSVNTLVRDSERLVRRVLGERISTELHLAPDAGGITGDPLQLEQLLLNMLMNARDAMPAGGTIVITTEQVTLGSAAAMRQALHPGDYVRLSVSDTGIGMDAATQQRVFEPFFTTKRMGEGTGLGLAQAYATVAQAGGSIAVQSSPGQGTTFTVLFPRSRAVDAPAQGDEAPREGRGELILLVEDERAVRASTRRLLEKHGYRVLEAQHGRDALQLWRERRDEVDLVLTDVRMPEMDGAQLASVLRAESPRARLLFMSGYARGASGDEIIGGEEAFLEKPFSSTALLARLREVLERP